MIKDLLYDVVVIGAGKLNAAERPSNMLTSAA